MEPTEYEYKWIQSSKAIKVLRTEFVECERADRGLSLDKAFNTQTPIVGEL